MEGTQEQSTRNQAVCFLWTRVFFPHQKMCLTLRPQKPPLTFQPPLKYTLCTGDMADGMLVGPSALGESFVPPPPLAMSPPLRFHRGGGVTFGIFQTGRSCHGVHAVQTLCLLLMIWR